MALFKIIASEREIMKYCNEFFLINDSKEIQNEYKRRHDALWPEMKQLITDIGFKNYTIWNIGSRLIDYYECDDLAAAIDALGKSEVKKKWDEYMKDILLYDDNGVMISHALEKAFEIN